MVVDYKNCVTKEYIKTEDSFVLSGMSVGNQFFPVDMIDKLYHAIHEDNGWIYVKDKLPEESGEYLVWIKHDGKQYCDICKIDCEGILKKWNYVSGVIVIAWQELPKLITENSKR